MPSPDLAAIEARAAAATEGPWEWDGSETWPSLAGRAGDHNYSYDTEVIDLRHSERGWSGACEVELTISEADRAFIASARTDVPALIARIRELEAENAKIDDLDEALRQRDREILGLRRDRGARDARVAELEGDG